MFKMASSSPPRTWIPYLNGKDCSKGLCSLNCPQWCYIIFPPPPPPPFDSFSGYTSSTSGVSPLVIAIIGVIVSALLLVSYYFLISKFCGKEDTDGSTRRRVSLEQVEELDDNQNPSLHEPWNTTTTGLDEALIKSIAVFEYKKEDGLIECTDCSVCLSEFQENESLRLLPKCSHAFHISCIDTWLKSHSNCPLCRANIVFSAPPPPPPPHVDMEGERVGSEDEITQQNNGDGKTTLLPSGALEEIGIEIRDEKMKRSYSMDHVRGDCLSWERPLEISKCGHCATKMVSQGFVVTMKRSFSSGRFFSTSHGRLTV